MNNEIVQKKLELIEAFENLSLYYYREDQSIWIYNGEKYYGADMMC